MADDLERQHGGRAARAGGQPHGWPILPFASLGIALASSSGSSSTGGSPGSAAGSRSSSASPGSARSRATSAARLSPSRRRGAASPSSAVEEGRARGGRRRYPRNVFLERSTLGLGALIGALVTVPALGFAIAPDVHRPGRRGHRPRPARELPRGQWRDRPVQSRKTSPGRLETARPSSATTAAERRAELHDHLEPLRPPGLPDPARRATDGDSRERSRPTPAPVAIIRTEPVGLPAARATAARTTPRATGRARPCARSTATSSRSSNGNLVLGSRYSVGKVEGTGATRQI